MKILLAVVLTLALSESAWARVVAWCDSESPLWGYTETASENDGIMRFRIQGDPAWRAQRGGNAVECYREVQGPGGTWETQRAVSAYALTWCAGFPMQFDGKATIWPGGALGDMISCADHIVPATEFDDQSVSISSSSEKDVPPFVAQCDCDGSRDLRGESECYKKFNYDALGWEPEAYSGGGYRISKEADIPHHLQGGQLAPSVSSAEAWPPGYKFWDADMVETQLLSMHLFMSSVIPTGGGQLRTSTDGVQMYMPRTPPLTIYVNGITGLHSPLTRFGLPFGSPITVTVENNWEVCGDIPAEVWIIHQRDPKGCFLEWYDIPSGIWSITERNQPVKAQPTAEPLKSISVSNPIKNYSADQFIDVGVNTFFACVGLRGTGSHGWPNFPLICSAAAVKILRLGEPPSLDCKKCPGPECPPACIDLNFCDPTCKGFNPCLECPERY